MSSGSDFGISNKDIPKSKNVDHGVSSWLEFKAILNNTKRGKELLPRFEPALKAIFRHNKPIRKIDSEKEPLSLFLFFV